MNSSNELEKERATKVTKMELNTAQSETNESQALVNEKANEDANEKANEEQMVIEYLQLHHDFFHHHPSLLSEIAIPHFSGGATSLIERQVKILREQNAQQKDQLTELFEIANENEQSNQKIHQLTLSLLDSKNINSSEKILHETLCHDFNVDAVSLRLFVEPKSTQAEHLFIPRDAKVCNELDKLLNTRKPMCGYFKKLPLHEFFADQADSLSSIALLPLFIEKNNCFGVLLMGSKNIRRFNADMGTVFLERLGETVSHIITSFVKKS